MTAHNGDAARNRETSRVPNATDLSRKLLLAIDLRLVEQTQHRSHSRDSTPASQLAPAPRAGRPLNTLPAGHRMNLARLPGSTATCRPWEHTLSTTTRWRAGGTAAGRCRRCGGPHGRT